MTFFLPYFPSLGKRKWWKSVFVWYEQAGSNISLHYYSQYLLALSHMLTYSHTRLTFFKRDWLTLNAPGGVSKRAKEKRGEEKSFMPKGRKVGLRMDGWKGWWSPPSLPTPTTNAYRKRAQSSGSGKWEVLLEQLFSFLLPSFTWEIQSWATCKIVDYLMRKRWCASQCFFLIYAQFCCGI